MAAKQRMNLANQQFHKNVVSRGNVKSNKSQSDKYPVP